MTFDPMSVEVTCVTVPKDHCVQVPWECIDVCRYNDKFCKNTTYYIHTHYVQNEWSQSLSEHVQARWPLTPCLLRSHVWLYPRIIVSKSHGNTSMYVDTMINFAKYHIHTYYVQNEWLHSVFLNTFRQDKNSTHFKCPHFCLSQKTMSCQRRLVDRSLVKLKAKNKKDCLIVHSQPTLPIIPTEKGFFFFKFLSKIPNISVEQIVNLSKNTDIYVKKSSAVIISSICNNKSMNYKYCKSGHFRATLIFPLFALFWASAKLKTHESVYFACRSM